MADIIQIRRDSAADWTSVDPTLADGEIGFESDTKKIKIGDGTTAWTSLAYFGGGGGILTATASGTDTYTATITGVSAYNTHDIYEIIFTNANTGSSTININSIAAKTLKKSVSTNLAGGDILAGQSFFIVYDGTNFQVIGLGGGGSGSVNSGTQYRIGYYATTGTAISEAAAITGARALKSDANGVPTHFDTATEPSLTELSYVKGVTSSIQTQLNATLTDSYYDRNAVAIVSSTLTLDWDSKRIKNFDLTTTRTSDFTIAFSNITNLVQGRLTMRLTGTINITLDSAVIMNNYEALANRWNTSTNILTLVGDTASPFVLEFVSDGTNIWCFASDKGL